MRPLSDEHAVELIKIAAQLASEAIQAKFAKSDQPAAELFKACHKAVLEQYLSSGEQSA